ncbi:MAG: bifunctional hydroxymethylpyrimidine kinase/phosphomethylpyrimidine kinase [Methanoregulaceae archaeon]|nr:bifunctional hydroxymethylpyrimidine kinase/phosphomethylpyrimidine kinase [Methanoregulaceae archaeon]
MHEAVVPCACTIAGSDSGGGAGLQADCKTFSAFGVWGATVVTAVTAQTSCAVRGIHLLSPEFVTLQMQAVFDDLPIRAVKTGMLGSAAICRAVAEGLPRDVLLVVDPVMVATSGDRLLGDGAVEAIVSGLLPKATVVTPNLAEAAVLAGTGAIRSTEGMREAALAILELGPEFVVVKGGHLGGETSPDFLAGPGYRQVLPARRLPHDVHGSGCCFSAALAACLARGEAVPESVTRAKSFVTAAIAHKVRGRCGGTMVNPTNLDCYR